MRTLKTFQGTHILGASRALLCDSYAVLLLWYLRALLYRITVFLSHIKNTRFGLHLPGVLFSIWFRSVASANVCWLPVWIRYRYWSHIATHLVLVLLLIGGRLFQKPNPTGMKFDRIVHWVNTHRLTTVRFWIWRHTFKMAAMTSFCKKPLARHVWRHWHAVCTTVPDLYSTVVLVDWLTNCLPLQLLWPTVGYCISSKE